MDTDMDIPAARQVKGPTLGRLSLIAAATLYAMGASAQTAEGDGARTANVGFTLGAGYSNNVFQSNFESSSAAYRSLGLIMDVDRESRRFRASAEGDLEHRFYSSSRIQDEPYGRLDAEIELRAVPERFSWMLENDYGEGRTDPFLALGPDNREQINIYETGPAVFLPLGEQTEFRIEGRAGQRSFDDSQQLDADTTSASAGVFREINSTTELGVTVLSREVEYSTHIADNQIDTAYFSYEKRFSSGTANVRLGVNEVEFGTRSDEAPYVNISWARDVGRRSNLSLGLVNQLIDAGDSLRGGFGVDREDTLLSFDVYEAKGVNAALNTEHERSSLTFGVSVTSDRYENSNEFDNDTFGINVSYSRSITSLMRFTGRVVVTNRDFQSTPQEYSDRRLVLGLEKAFSRKLALSAELEHSTRGNARALNFDENLFAVHIRYDLNPPQRTPGLSD